MNEIRRRNEGPNSEPRFPGQHSRSSVLEIDSWMPSKIQAVSPVVNRLMRLIERSDCVSGTELDVELAIREALENAVVHGNQEDPQKKVHIRCRCESGSEVSIVVSDQGNGFDFLKALDSGLATSPETANGHGIQLMKTYMDELHFERGGSEVHMSKRSRGDRQRSART